MDEKKPEPKTDEPQFHPEYPFPAPPMGMPLSDEDDEKPKQGKD